MSPGQPYTSSEKEYMGEGSPKAQGIFDAQDAAADELPVKVDEVLSYGENAVAKFKQVLKTVADTRADYVMVDKAHAFHQVTCPKSLKSKSAESDKLLIDKFTPGAITPPL